MINEVFFDIIAARVDRLILTRKVDVVACFFQELKAAVLIFNEYMKS